VLKDHKERTDFNTGFFKKIIHSADIVVRESTSGEQVQNIYHVLVALFSVVSI